MRNLLLRLYVKLQGLVQNEERPDLVEYTLLIALITFGATVGAVSMSSAIDTAFGNISSTLGTSIT